jgi:hypothetical protein
VPGRSSPASGPLVARSVCPSFGRRQDILHGDMNGLIQVPADAAEGLPKAIESVRTRERRLMDMAKDPNFAASQLHGRFMH